MCQHVWLLAYPAPDDNVPATCRACGTARTFDNTKVRAHRTPEERRMVEQTERDWAERRRRAAFLVRDEGPREVPGHYRYNAGR